MNSSAEIELFLDHLTVERGLARNTLLAYRRDITRYCDFLASLNKTISDATESDIENFLTVLRSGDDNHQPLSVSSAARSIIALRGFHKFHAQIGRAHV